MKVPTDHIYDCKSSGVICIQTPRQAGQNYMRSADITSVSQSVSQSVRMLVSPDRATGGQCGGQTHVQALRVSEEQRAHKEGRPLCRQTGRAEEEMRRREEEGGVLFAANISAQLIPRMD